MYVAFDLTTGTARRVLLSLLAALAMAGTARGELVRNGDFEQPLEGTWDTSLVNNEGGEWIFLRSDSLGQPSPGFAVKVGKRQGVYASMNQTVAVPDADLDFSFDARFVLDTSTSYQSWPTPAVILHYLDTSGTELGATTWYKHDRYNTWYEDSTHHLIDVGSAEGWNHYQLVLRWEMANLPGVRASDIARIKIELYAFLQGC